MYGGFALFSSGPQNSIHRPIRQKPYGIPQAYKEKVMEELEEMEKNGIIEQSDSEWASPMVIVTKKDGEVQLCIDYRRLSAVTKFDAYPMPRIDELLDRVGNAHFISTLDLAKGYWQVPIKDCLYYTKRIVSVHKHALWIKWSTTNISTNDGQCVTRDR